MRFQETLNIWRMRLGLFNRALEYRLGSRAEKLEQLPTLCNTNTYANSIQQYVQKNMRTPELHTCNSVLVQKSFRVAYMQLRSNGVACMQL